MTIPITKTVFDEEDFASVVEPLKNGWVVSGPFVKKFEEMVAEFCGAENAIAVTSCTTALHLSLVTAGIVPGDEVVVPSFTFIATANAVEYTGATPLFCDIDLATFNINVDQFETLVKKRNGAVKAVIPVHLFGLCADMAPIIKIAERYGITVIEDAACAFGSYYKNSHAGTFGVAGCFSFHPRKAITTGEGGMIVTRDSSFAETVWRLRSHGGSKSDLQRHMEQGGALLPEYDELGYNYRMTDIQGALGVSQMKKAERILNERRRGAEMYNRLLNQDFLINPSAPHEYVHSYQSYVCLVDKSRFGGDLHKANVFRNRLMVEMERAGISVRQGTHAVHTLGYYRDKYGIDGADFPKSLEADRLSMSLPLYAGITEQEISRVVEHIKNISGKLLDDV